MQQRLFDYGETVYSPTFLALTKNLILPGLYRGFDLFRAQGVVGSDTVELRPGCLLLPNGVFVEESASQRFHVAPPVDLGGSVNYLLICRHRVKTVFGGTPAEFLVIENSAEAIADALDSTDDPDHPWSYLVVGYINNVTVSGLISATLSTPERILDSLNKLVRRVVPGQDGTTDFQLSYDEVFAVPFGSKVSLINQSGYWPLPQQQYLPPAELTAALVTNSGGVTTVSAPMHGLTTGAFVCLSNSTVPEFLGVVGPITVIDADNFSFVQAGSVGASATDVKVTSCPFSTVLRSSVDKRPYYDVRSCSLLLTTVVPNGMIPVKVGIIAKNRSLGSASITIKAVNDASGTPVPLDSSGVTEIIKQFTQSTVFTRQDVSLLASVGAFPANGQMTIELELLNVQIAAVVISYNGAQPSNLEADGLDASGVIWRVAVTP